MIKGKSQGRNPRKEKRHERPKPEIPELILNLLSSSKKHKEQKDKHQTHNETSRKTRYAHQEPHVKGKVPREYIEMCDTKTGEIFLVPKGRFGRFKRAVKKIINYYKYRNKQIFCTHYCIYTARTLTTEERNRFLSNLRKYRSVNNLDLHYILFLSIYRDENSGTPYFYIYNLVIFCTQPRFPSLHRIQKWWPQEHDVILGYHIGIKKTKLKSTRALLEDLEPFYDDSFEYFDLAKNRIKSFFTSYIMPVFKLNRERFEQVVQRLGYPFWKYFKGFKLDGLTLYIWTKNMWKQLLEFEQRYIFLDPNPEPIAP
ncbi:MAG: hypothetical protein QXX12_06695 [Nanopusillaceae archaeon]